MGFFEGARDFEINGGNFIDIRGGQIQYNTNAMSITGNNNNAEMNPVFNAGGPSTAYHAPRYGPSQSNTSTYPGYAQTNSPHTNPSYTPNPPPHTNSAHADPPYNPAMYSAADQRNIYYNYQAFQSVQAQYQPGQQQYPYQPQRGQQPHHDFSQGQQSYHRPSQSGQQSHPHPSQPGQRSYTHPSQPEQRPYHSPPQHSHQSYHYPPQQQSTTSVHQYQQVFQSSTADAQRHRSTTPSSTADSEDPDVTEIRENLERQDLS